MIVQILGLVLAVGLLHGPQNSVSGAAVSEDKVDSSPPKGVLGDSSEPLANERIKDVVTLLVGQY